MIAGRAVQGNACVMGNSDAPLRTGVLNLELTVIRRVACVDRNTDDAQQSCVDDGMRRITWPSVVAPLRAVTLDKVDIHARVRCWRCAYHDLAPQVNQLILVAGIVNDC